MAKEALNSPYAKLIFRETFRDEQSVRRNGGVPTAVTFFNGVASFNGSNSVVNYGKSFNFPISSTVSVRIKFKTGNTINNVGMLFGQESVLKVDVRSSNQIFFFTSNTSGTGWVVSLPANVTITPNTNYEVIGVLNGSSAQIYVNGNLNNSMLAGAVLGNNNNLVTSGARYYSALQDYFNGNIYLIEVYNSALTASEVKNLYENKWNKEVSGYGGQPGVNLVTNGTFDTDVSGWNALRCELTWQSGGFCRCTQNFGASQTMAVYQNSILTIGKKYKVRFIAKSSNNSTYPNVLPGHFSDVNWSKRTNYTESWQEYEFTGIAVTNQSYVYLVNSNVDNGTVVDIDSFFVQELNPELLLDFDSTRGSIKDRTGKRTLTPTAVTIKKIGQSYSADFNGSTSLINTGSDFIGTKAVTFFGWINYRGGQIQPRIIDNGRFSAGVVLATNRLAVTSDNYATVALTTSGAIINNTWQFIAFTRSLTGVVNIYLGSVNSPPSLNGSANQASGTPAAATTILALGNVAAITRTFDGSIPLLQVYEGILSIEDITQIWSSTRNKFI